MNPGICLVNTRDSDLNPGIPVPGIQKSRSEAKFLRTAMRARVCVGAYGRAGCIRRILRMAGW
eukprot:304346-Amorphochlora_amoeboformis.AAC.1